MANCLIFEDHLCRKQIPDEIKLFKTYSGHVEHNAS